MYGKVCKRVLIEKRFIKVVCYSMLRDGRRFVKGFAKGKILKGGFCYSMCRKVCVMLKWAYCWKSW